MYTKGHYLSRQWKDNSQNGRKYLQIICRINPEYIKSSNNSVSKKQTTEFKNGQNISTCFQRTHTDGQEPHEKMLNITNHQENAKQNHNVISPSHLSEWLSSRSPQKTMSARTWKGTLINYWWECKLV